MHDEDIASMDTTTRKNPLPTYQSEPAAITQGPITRARARQLNYQVNAFLGLHTNIQKDGILLNACNDIILLRNEEINTSGRATRKPHERMQGINPNKQVGTCSSELMTSLK